MPSLVEELQRDAIDEKVSVATLLRKSLAVATKLNLVEFRKWTEHELNGYLEADVPDYRKVRGRVVFRNRFGETPVVFGDAEIADMIETHEYGAPLGPIEESSNNNSSGFFIHEFPSEQQTFLLSLFPSANGLALLHIPKNTDCGDPGFRSQHHPSMESET